jgi:MFS family permease
VTTVERAGTLAAFESRDFRLLWGGQAVSLVGDAAFLVALGWRVTELRSGSSSLGVVLGVNAVCLLATLLFGGVLADRYSQRLLMISSDLARLVVAAVFCGLEASGHLSFPAIVVLAGLFGLGDGFFNPAFSAIVPLVVEAPVLPSANSWIGIARQGSAVVGPGVAAGLYGAVGPTAVWGLEAASFSISALALWLARPRLVDRERHGLFAELAIGFRYVTGVPWIWTGIGAATVILMIAMAPYNVLLPHIIRDHYERGVGSYGLLFSLIAVGMVAGSLSWARWHPRHGRIPLCFAAFGLNDLGMIAVALSPWYGLACAAVVWRGFWIGIGIAAWTTLVTELVPEHLLSRVFSFDFFGSFGLTPVGYALAGAVAASVAPSTVLAVGGALAFVLWLVPLAWPRVRTAA